MSAGLAACLSRGRSAPPLGSDTANRCSFHPDTEAVARCSACNRDLCQRCVIPILGRVYCQKCVYLFADLPTVFKQLHQSAEERARLAAEKERITSELRIAHDMQMS
ncbi:MAG TPA: hypothetical protein VHR86_09195, partial [Armatimonadota bacterium]|nr:hypothetical protein [Armatimonadota bacterium]